MAGRETRRWRLFVFVLTPALLTGLMLAEITLRAVRPQLLHWNTAAVWEPAEDIGWQRRPNLDVVVNTGDGPVRVITDAARHRVGTAPVSGAEIEILALGDSFVEALQVEHELTMTSLLGARLTDHLGVTADVVNAGLGGRNPNHYLLAARRELDAGSYDLVLVFLFLQNDRIARLRDRFPPRRGLGPLAGSNGASAPAPLGVRDKAHRFLSSTSHLWVFLTNLRLYLSRDRDATFLDSFLVDNDRSDAWHTTGEALSRITQLAREKQVETLFVLLPPYWFFDEALLDETLWAYGLARDEIDPSLAGRRLLEELSSRGLDAIDATASMRVASEDGVDDLYGRVDKHLGAGGHRVLADFLFDEVVVRLAVKRDPESMISTGETPTEMP